MTELQRYLAEEVAEDHADGIITRREAVRRLGLLGVGASAAAAMLGAQAAAAAAAAPASKGGGATSTAASRPTWAPVATEPITFAGPTATLQAAWAPAVKPRGGVLVIHENRGLNDHIRTVAGRFAASGWSALALDLLSEEGGTASFPGEAEVAAALAPDPARAVRRRHEGGAWASSRGGCRASALAAIGFCFGGGMVWRLLAAGERRLAAAAPFYGPFPEGGDLRGTRAALLAVYGGLDTRVNATRDAAKAAARRPGCGTSSSPSPQADHAFFNDTGARFNAPAAAEACRRVLEWFDDASHKGGARRTPTSRDRPRW